MCDKGEFESKFEVSPKNIKLQGYHVASQADNIAGKHIKSFGSCSIMGNCKMESDLYGQFLIWFETYSKVRFAGSEALLEDSYCFCAYGGKITVFDSKQVEYASAMAELFGDFADMVEQMKDNIENLSDMAVKSLIEIFDGAMTEYFENEENRLGNAVRDMERNNTGNSYMYMQTGYNPKEKLAQLQRSKQTYGVNNWEDIKNVNLRDVYVKMQENPNKVDLGSRKVPLHLGLINPVFLGVYYVETKVRDIRSVLPDMTIGDFFNRGTSSEGITELWEKGMDCQNKKMLSGMLGHDPLQAAYAGGYTTYDPAESMKIVDSMSDDGKAAYMLRKTANDGMSAYNEMYGYYQMVKALSMSMKGKVKTGKVKLEKEPVRDGASRAKDYAEQWEKSSLQEAVEIFAGENPVEYHNQQKSKVMFLNTETDIQVVYDYKGNYFRIEDKSVPSKKVRYLQMNGNNPYEFITERGTKQGTSPQEYKRLTHFLNIDNLDDK
ncbi:DUF4280 domain-containing protein [Sebaldella sp. S0638]|nr:DUF4280 domain-containing protein [Sebaldella sp. S0638]